MEWSGPVAWSGIAEFAWNSDEPWASAASPAGACWIRPRDLLKFGSLYADRGRWNGKQVLAEEWVAASLEPHVARSDALREHGEGAASRGSYGYFWWYDRYTLPYGELTVHAAYGNGGQRIWVVPELQLTAVHLTGNYNIGTSSWNAERLLLERIVPWALGIETTYRHQMGRATLMVDPGEWPLVALSPDEPARYVGEYDEDGYRTEVREAQGALEVTLPGGGAFDLIPEGEHSFAGGHVENGQVRKIFWPGWSVVFVFDEDGAVAGYEFRKGEVVVDGGTRVAATESAPGK